MPDPTGDAGLGSRAGPLPAPAVTPAPGGLAPSPLSAGGLPGAAEELSEFGAEVRSQWRLVLGRFFRHRLALASMVVLFLLVAVAFLGEAVSGYRFDERTPSDLSVSPSLDHWFGTNQLGIDTFAQVQRGAQRSIEVAFLVAFLSTGVGALVGSLAGYYRG